MGKMVLTHMLQNKTANYNDSDNINYNTIR